MFLPLSFSSVVLGFSLLSFLIGTLSSIKQALKGVATVTFPVLPRQQA
jgi:hypothetical protein